MSGSLFKSSSTTNLRSSSVSMKRSAVSSDYGYRRSSFSTHDIAGLPRLEDKIRQLHDDLETERDLRNRIERERADLSVQLITMTDRLDDAEGTTDSQIESNRKREVELNKLRKVLEDCNLENEDVLTSMRKKHQESILDFQDQVEQVHKKNTKIERDRQRFQHEVIEMTRAVDQLRAEKHICEKAAEKYALQAKEVQTKVDDLNKHVCDLSQAKSRLLNENNDLSKEMHDVKVQMENSLHIKVQLAHQLDEARRRLEDAEKERSHMQTQLHQVQLDLDSARNCYEEESACRSEAEHKLNIAYTEVTQWKSKYDAELILHHEEAEELRKKTAMKISEYEEQIEIMIQKISQLEKTKSRLQQEIEILIVDLEKAQNQIIVLERANEQLEKLSCDLKVRLDELAVRVEAAQREAKVAQAELQKIKHLYEKAIEQRDALARENKKLQDDLHGVKECLADANRKMHELDMENSRLSNDIRELHLAVKEAEAAHREAEAKAQKVQGEIVAMRAEMEHRLLEKQEQMESMRSGMQYDIDRLTSTLADIEVRIKNEISRLRKKYQAEICELETAITSMNTAVLEAHKTIKRQIEQIKVIQSNYEDCKRQLSQALDLHSMAQRKLAMLNAELEECRSALDVAVRARKSAEVELESSSSRIVDLTSINNNLTSIKGKLETDLISAQADLDEAQKELCSADERASRVQQEATRAVEQLHEEQEHSMKIDSMRRALEDQVKVLQGQMAEAEAAALLGGKRVVAKLEVRIRDLELSLDEETRRHKESQGLLRKKDRHVKELQMAVDEEHKMFVMAQDSSDRLCEKVNVYKRQLAEAESTTAQNLQRVRRYQHALEDMESRAESVESSLHILRSKHRSSVRLSKSSSKVFFMDDQQ